MLLTATEFFRDISGVWGNSRAPLGGCFETVRRAFAGLRRVQSGFGMLFIRGRERDWFGGDQAGFQAAYSLLDLIGLKCPNHLLQGFGRTIIGFRWVSLGIGGNRHESSSFGGGTEKGDSRAQ